ncbi:structural maintenance of chromosomes protein 5-like [Physella acuta]|uniref:structural maintenance of chromosomes protein 5-like n=1 Tax=Physella acuta TaxID=109671 RepID=UPI0027DCC115|nr:structural maintenance of chromosomes protein 5-like [Physella acuta]
MSYSKKRQRIDNQHENRESPSDLQSHSQNKSKKVIHSKQDSGFVEGSIVSIKLHKFLTYDSVEFKTGPYLNIIIGPNGTGKSAIVCAICLGLAGKTTWLGRASDAKDFIKYGSEKAKIVIELFNPYDDSNYVISREIYSNKPSHWWINGRTTTQKAVEECVASLKVQVGNLCQFLPQEKVADFARMTQQELLENMEKAVGVDNLYENHQKLKGARQEARVLEQEVEKLETELNQEKQKNARLEEDVKSYHDRHTFLKKAEVLKMKKPWLEYQLLKDQYERAKTEKDKKHDELKQERKIIQPLENKCVNLKKQKEILERVTRELSTTIRSKAKELEAQSQAMNTKTEKIAEVKNDFEAKLKEEDARKKKLSDLQEQLKALELGLANMNGTDAQLIAKALENISEQMRNVNVEITSVHTEGEELHREISRLKADIRDTENQVHHIQDVNNRRLEILRTLHSNTYEAVKWLRENKSLFKSTINEPMILSLNVTRPEDAKLVESHISFNDLRSFVCEDPDDLDLFMREVKNKLKLRVNAVKAPSQPVESFKPPHPIGRYRQYGFERYMQSLFTCPDPVMRYLCMMYRVHAIPIGSNAIKDNIDRILAECQELSIFYTSDVQYSIKKSRYTGDVSSRNTALRRPKALADSINTEREQELLNRVKDLMKEQKTKEEQYKILQKKSEVLEIQINDLREQKRNQLKQKDQRKNVENQIITKKQRIQQVMREEVNMQAEEQKLQTQLKAIVHDKFKCLELMKNISLDCIKIAKDRIIKSLQLAEHVRDFSIVETEFQNAKQKFEGLEKEVVELQDHVADLKHQAREKLVDAKRKADIGMQDNLEEKLTERGLWEDFKNAPSRLDELDNEIHSVQARAEAMFQVDEKVVQDFRKREKEIAKLEKLLHETERRHQSHQSDIAEVKRRWLEPLNELIHKINIKYCYFFSCLKCCGEVSLSIPENTDDYEKYGVCIKVKFRDDEILRELNAHHQSGGERSVSTVLFMIALQELTKCPFRCVDEINQGMDPKNERKVFELVVQTVCKANASQYFLLTPKLLPDLEYDKNVRVLCVYNGPQLMEHKEWNLKNFIRRRAALVVNNNTNS